MIQTDDPRWTALQTRDPAADGRFVYSVDTTGVYCRPSCAARLALRRNVRFHDSCAAAEQAGFRPCKRCRPNEAPLAERHAQAVQNACRAIEAADTAPELETLAQAAHLSRFHFLRVFRKVTGLTPRQYAANHRAERVRAELRTGASITTAIYDAGFNSGSRFYEKSSEILGMTASQYKGGGKGVEIRYTISQSSLGLVIIAGTTRGICAVRFGDSKSQLIEDLRQTFPEAAVAQGNEDFDQWAKAVIEQIDHPAQPRNLPLDIQGTAFQQRVWQALREIPAGATQSYAQLAARIGSPNAVRAVGTACGANPVAVLVPCHRAVRSDGSLAGYRWGLDRKQQLLQKEAVPRH